MLTESSFLITYNIESHLNRDYQIMKNRNLEKEKKSQVEN